MTTYSSCSSVFYEKITKFDVQLVMVWYFWEPVFVRILMENLDLKSDFPQNLGISVKFRDLGANSPQNLGISMIN